MRASGIAAFDFDGDGDSDVVISSTQPMEAAVFLNQGLASFPLPLRVPVKAGGPDRTLRFGDLDGDGRVDPCASESFGLVWLLSQPGPQPDANRLRLAQDPVQVAVMDLDGDGDLGLAAACTDFLTGLPGIVAVAKDDGRGVLTLPRHFAARHLPAFLEPLDIDGGRDLDFLAACFEGVIAVVGNELAPLTPEEDADAIPDACESGAAIRWRRGDANADGKLDIADAVAILRFLLAGGASPPCADAADADDDGSIGLTDGIRLLLRLFQGAAVLPAPEKCGRDPTTDDLTCSSFLPCNS